MPATSSERLVFASCNCVGLPVQVHTKTGTVYEGIYQTAQLDPALANPGSVVLAKVRARQHGPKGRLSDAVTQELVVKASDMVQMIVQNLDLSFAAKGGQGRVGANGAGDHLAKNGRHGVLTDSEIGSTSRFRSADSRANELVAWDAGNALTSRAGSSVSMELGSEGSSVKSWDQFKINETKFDYKTTWDENLYTTKLDMTKVNSEDIRAAERLAREIEKKSRPGATDHLDEEDRFGAVIRDRDQLNQHHRSADTDRGGRYSPPTLGGSRQSSRGMVVTSNGPSGGAPGCLVSDDKGKYVPPNRRISGHAEAAAGERPGSGTQSRSRDQSPAKGTSANDTQQIRAPPGITTPPTKSPASSAAHSATAIATTFTKSEKTPTVTKTGKEKTTDDKTSRSKEVASLRKFSENFNLETDGTRKKSDNEPRSESTQLPETANEAATDMKEDEQALEKARASVAPAAGQKLNPNASEFKPNPNATAFVPSKNPRPEAPVPVVAPQLASGMYMGHPGGIPMVALGGAGMYAPGMVPPQMMQAPLPFAGPQAHQFAQMQQMQHMQMMMHHQQQQTFMQPQGQFPPPS